MNFLGNIIWFILGGFLTSVLYCLSGLVMCITVIGIPWGVQHFKIAKYSLVPFGCSIE